METSAAVATAGARKEKRQGGARVQGAGEDAEDARRGGGWGEGGGGGDKARTERCKKGKGMR